MTKQLHILIVLACLLNLSAAGSSIADEEKDGSARKCIPTRKLTSTAVIDDRNILFLMTGKGIYHNILPKRCTGLAGQTFTYGSLAGSLCNLDTIRVIKSAHGTLGRLCRLGNFYPITNEDLPAIIKALQKPPQANPLPSADMEDVAVESDKVDDQAQNPD